MSIRRVLLVDDAPGTRKQISNLLNEAGFDVISCRQIDQAKEYFSAHYNDIDCLVVDLNMSDEWLGEYQTESDGGMLSGWVFVNRFVNQIKPEMPIVIYSGFIDYLYSIYKPLDSSCIRLVSKNDEIKGGPKGLLHTIKQLLQEKEHESYGKRDAKEE